MDIVMTERDANNHDERFYAQRFPPDATLHTKTFVLRRRVALFLVGRIRVPTAECKSCHPADCTSDIEYSGPACKYSVRADGPKTVTAEGVHFPNAHPTARLFVTFEHPRLERLRLIPFSAIIAPSGSCVTFTLDSDNLVVSTHLKVKPGPILAGLPTFRARGPDHGVRPNMDDWVYAMALCRHWHPHVCESAAAFAHNIHTSPAVKVFVSEFRPTHTKRLCFRGKYTTPLLHASTGITANSAFPLFMEFAAIDAKSYITEHTDPVVALVIADSAYYGMWYESMNIAFHYSSGTRGVAGSPKSSMLLQAFLFAAPFEYQQQSAFEWLVSDHKTPRRQILQRRLAQGALGSLKEPFAGDRLIQFPTMTRPTVRNLLQQRREPDVYLPLDCDRGTCSSNLKCCYRPHRLQEAIVVEGVMLASQGSDRWEGMQDVWSIGVLFHSLFAGMGGLLLRDHHQQVSVDLACARAHTCGLHAPGVAACYQMSYRLATCSVDVATAHNTNFSTVATGPDVELFVDHYQIRHRSITKNTTDTPPAKRPACRDDMFGGHKSRKMSHVYPCLANKKMTV
jgi:hypothetical protein